MAADRHRWHLFERADCVQAWQRPCSPVRAAGLVALLKSVLCLTLVISPHVSACAPMDLPPPPIDSPSDDEPAAPAARSSQLGSTAAERVFGAFDKSPRVCAHRQTDVPSRVSSRVMPLTHAQVRGF